MPNDKPVTTRRLKLARKIYFIIENRINRRGFPPRWDLDNIIAVDKQLEKAGIK